MIAVATSHHNRNFTIRMGQPSGRLARNEETRRASGLFKTRLASELPMCFAAEMDQATAMSRTKAKAKLPWFQADALKSSIESGG
jgi:hypothetical protein